MLEVKNIAVSYDGSIALNDVSIHVDAGEFVSIVGPNGAGKSTLFKAISGTVELSGGSIQFEGVDLSKIAPARRPHLGIAHVPEYRQVFKELTVRENLMLGANALKDKKKLAAILDYLYDAFPILLEKTKQLAGTLSGGQQQMLAISRGLCSDPKLLMLDEPSMGISPGLAAQIFARLCEIQRERNVTILLVEQRAADALAACNRAYVLSTGRITASGTGKEVSSNSTLTSAYLGSDETS